MADKAHRLTDAELEKMEKHLTSIYKRAEEELEKKAEKYFKRFEELDKQKQALVKSGAISDEDYKKWRQNKIMTGKHWTTLKEQTAKELLNANKTAQDYINGKLPQIYTQNYNSVSGSIESGIKGYSFEMVDQSTVRNLAKSDDTLLPYKYVDGVKDVRWNTQKVNSEILQGIIQGDSIPNLAKRLRNVTEMNRASAIRNARTTVTSAENKGRMDMLHDAQDKGVNMVKVWLATNDGRTREAHEDLNGQERPIDEPFDSMLGEIMYPGDPDADPANVYNCRCTLTYKVVGFGKPDEEEANRTDSEKPDDSIGDAVKPERPRKSDFDDYDEFLAAREKYHEERAEYEAIRDKAVDSVINGEQEFKNTEELLAWAEDRGIKIEDSFAQNIDLRFCNEVKPELDNLFERFPEVKSYETEYFDGSKIEVGFSLRGEKKGVSELASAGNGINFNAFYWGNDSLEYGLKNLYDDMASGGLVRGDGSAKPLIAHEFGHNVQSYIEDQMSDKYHYHVDDWRINFGTFDEYIDARNKYLEERSAYRQDLLSLVGLSGSSDYSNTNEHELFAEGFAEYATGGDKTEFGQKFGEFLRRWY